MAKLRVVELFAGIGAQAAALNRIGANWESVGVVEIDEKCVTAYNAIHGTSYKPLDITQVAELPECDMVTYSFPCQDISTAGQQKGFDLARAALIKNHYKGRDKANTQLYRQAGNSIVVNLLSEVFGAIQGIEKLW